MLSYQIHGKGNGHVIHVQRREGEIGFGLIKVENKVKQGESK
jgi:hypothetical protein